MKEVGWEWVNSKKKVATKIMWETQGQDYAHVVALIEQACDLDTRAARALYRKICRDSLEAQGFVPAQAPMGRPRKNALPAPAVAPAPHDPYPAPKAATVQREPEPEPERTATGERKSIADMKAYLENLKKKVKV